MPQSLTSILVHIIFSTKNHFPFIDADIAKELYPYISSVTAAYECPALKIGGTKDHIHLLCSLSKTKSVGDIIEKVKTSSSKRIKTKGMKYKKFFWQSGYAAFSIGQSGKAKLISYIESQREHHKKITFKDELRALLKKYDVDFDERYIWD